MILRMTWFIFWRITILMVYIQYTF